MEFPDQNNTNFPQALKTFYSKLKYDKNEFLRFHQYVITQYIANNPTQRGILIMHQTGMGKSILAVAIAELIRKKEPSRKIIILSAKALASNFRKAITEYIKNTESSTLADTIIDKYYKFVSLNASNMFLQVYRSQKTKEVNDFEKNLADFNLTATDNFMDNTLLIVDEAHNLFNAIANGSKNAISLYDTIMKTKNIKLIFLSGTPIVNHPFELVPCFNMIKGKIYIDSRKKKSATLFPENKMEFDNFFINYQKNAIKNRNRFQNRILGLSSYYGSIYLDDKTHEGYPEQYSIKVEVVNMSAKQFAAYETAREMERAEASYGKRSTSSDRFVDKSSLTSSYRIKSRQISNYYIPEYALEYVKGKRTPIKYIEKITEPDLKDLKTHSPKISKILENIKKHKGLQIVYSEFVGSSIAIFSRILELNGYTNWENIKQINGSEEIFGGLVKNKSIYAIITGQTDMAMRDDIIKVFKNENNMHGEIISLLVVSRVVAEGVDLKYIRATHTMEPFFNMSRIMQFIGRAVRYNSHKGLPKNEQNVQPYIYLSDYPESYPPKKRIEDTTDVELYKTALKNKMLIDDAIINIIEASVDCYAHRDKLSQKVQDKIKCRMCLPTDNLMYQTMVARDLKLNDPCIQMEVAKIKAKEIILDDTGEKFYYTIKPSDSNDMRLAELFMYDANIDGYVPMNHNHPYYSILMRKLLKI